MSPNNNANKNTSTFSSILITGANVGLGKETARKLALEYSNVKRIVLAGRSKDKITTAKKDLEEETKRTDIFETLIVDMSNIDMIKSAVQNDLKEPVDFFLMNAGGPGGDNFASLNEQGVMHVIQINTLGHMVMLEEMIAANKLLKGAAFSGSEASRGAPGFGLPAPDVKEGSVEDFVGMCDGSFYDAKGKKDGMLVYGFAKLLATYYMGSMARRYPNLRFITVSPGATAGTNVANHAPTAMDRISFKLMLPVLRLFGVSHGVNTGAQRYIDVMQNNANTFESGHFYASPFNKTSGPLMDQAADSPKLFYNPTFEDNAFEALHKFVV